MRMLRLALTFLSVYAPEGLAGHPIQQIISGTFLSGRRGKGRRMVRRAELIQSGIALPTLDIVKSADSGWPGVKPIS
jgi:hypothetical protein